MTDLPTVQGWMPSCPVLLGLLDDVTTASQGIVPGNSQVSDADVEVLVLDGVPLVTCVEVPAHVDKMFPEWTIFLVLRANGHLLRSGSGKARLEVPMEQGQVIVLNIHTPHSVVLPRGRRLMDIRRMEDKAQVMEHARQSLMVAVTVDLHEPPSMVEAERLLTVALQARMERKRCQDMVETSACPRKAGRA